VSDPRLSQIGPGLATALFYVEDFASATGHFSVLAHTWSLAVEEQFYMIWPFVLGMMLVRFRDKYQTIKRVLLGLCALGFVWHLVSIFLFGYNWTYYSPDSNAIFLLTGCAFAAARQAGRSLVVPRPVAVAALVAVCVLPLVITRVAVEEWQIQALLMFPVDLAGGVLVLAATRLPILKLPLLRWFGRISYGLYLWNWLLISMEPDGRPLSEKERIAAGVLAIGAAAVSWYLVESPILQLKQRYHRGDLVPQDGARANARQQEAFDELGPTILPRVAETMP
jgi:peptidoglycan/LPS O-acetylase OafA/YrhL